MFKRLLLAASFLFTLVTPSDAAIHWFQQGRPDNTLPCSQADPCDNFSGTTLDNSGALTAGDIISLNRGDEWVGAEAQIEVNTVGTSGSRITVRAHGTGANPILAGAAVTTVGWSDTGTNNIWTLAGQSQTWLSTVTQQDIYGLRECESCTTTTLIEGTFKRVGSTLYVRLWDNVSPATNNVRVGNFAHTSDADGSRGLLRSTDTVARAHYHDFKDITIIGANGVGFSYSGTGGRDVGVKAVGSGWDGWLCYHIEGSGGECQDYESYYFEQSYGAALGPGFGQGVTSYGGPFGAHVGLHSFKSNMAGHDWLDFSSATNVTEVFCLRCNLHENSLSPDDPSFDANGYADGASEAAYLSTEMWGGGGTIDNARASFGFGSEHPTTKPAENIYCINCLIHSAKWVAMGPGEVCYDSVDECPPDGTTEPGNIGPFTLYQSTLIARAVGGFNMVFTIDNHSDTAGSWRHHNNIFVSTSGTVNNFMDAGSFITSNYNLYYDVGNSSTSTPIFQIDGVNKSLAQWQSDSGEDANSLYDDPEFVNYEDGENMDAHLAPTSPAINAGGESLITIPSWLPQTVKDDIGPCGIGQGGSVLASGVPDSCSNLDMGYHYTYAGLTSVTASAASLTASATTSYTFQFTMPSKVTALLYNWGIKVTFPAGFTLNSGGTSAATSSNITGTWSACSVAGQTITCERAGDGESEFPGTFNVTISQVGNPSSAGTTGTFTLETLDTTDTRIAYNDAVPAVTIASGEGGGGGGSPIAAHVLTGRITRSGRVTLA